MFAQLGRRLSVALVGAPVVLLAAWHGGLFFLTLALLIALASAFEFIRLLQHKSQIPAQVLTLTAIFFLFITVYLKEFELLPALFAAYLVSLFVSELFRRENAVIANTSTALLTFFYIGALSVFMLALRELPEDVGLEYQAGGEWVLVVFVAVWVCDSAAYFVGSRFGKHKLAPKISPNKTIEGALGGLFGSLLVTISTWLFFKTSFGLEQAIVTGMVVGVLGQKSDLLESLFKRDAGVKDTSAILPGHGGVLDRFDSELLVFPVIYFYFRWSFS